MIRCQIPPAGRTQTSCLAGNSMESWEKHLRLQGDQPQLPPRMQSISPLDILPIYNHLHPQPGVSLAPGGHHPLWIHLQREDVDRLVTQYSKNSPELNPSFNSPLYSPLDLDESLKIALRWLGDKNE